MAEPRLVPPEEAPVHRPVTRGRGWPRGKPRGPRKPSTRDQVAQTLVELRPACTSAAEMSSSSTSTNGAAAPVLPPPPKTAVSELVNGKSKEEKFQLLGAVLDEALQEVVAPLVKRLVREDPRTAELIEVKKELHEVEKKLDENKHFDQRVLEEGQKMKRHFDEALAELAPLKKRLTEAPTPPAPDPRVEKLERQNQALAARLNAIEARIGAMEETN